MHPRQRAGGTCRGVSEHAVAWLSSCGGRGSCGPSSRRRRELLEAVASARHRSRMAAGRRHYLVRAQAPAACWRANVEAGGVAHPFPRPRFCRGVHLEGQMRTSAPGAADLAREPGPGESPMEPCTSWPDAIGSSQERIALRVIGTVRRSANGRDRLSQMVVVTQSALIQHTAIAIDIPARMAGRSRASSRARRTAALAWFIGESIVTRSCHRLLADGTRTARSVSTAARLA